MGVWFSDGAEGVDEVRAIIDGDMVTLCQTVEGTGIRESVMPTGGLASVIAEWFETTGRKVVGHQEAAELQACY